MNARKNGIDVPPVFIEFSRSIEIGQIVPYRQESDPTIGQHKFVTFLGREEDEVAYSIGFSPTIEMTMTSVSQCGVNKNVTLTWLFLNIIGDGSYLYPIGFDLAHPENWHDLEILSVQPFFEIVLCGDSFNTATRISLLSAIQDDMRNLLSRHAKSCRVEWTRDEFVAALTFAHCVAPTPEELLMRLFNGGSEVEELRGPVFF